MIGTQAAVGHHVDLDTEQLARICSKRRNREQPDAGRAGDQDVQIASWTVGATSRGAEDANIAEAIATGEAHKVAAARGERIMRQWARGRPQSLQHLCRGSTTPGLISGNVRLSNPRPSRKFGLTQTRNLTKRSNWIRHDVIISRDMSWRSAGRLLALWALSR